MPKFGPKTLKLVALAFAGVVVLVAAYRHSDAAGAAVVSAFALIGTLLCNMAGVCPL